MRTVVVTALFVSLLLASGTAGLGAGTEEGVDVKLPDVFQSLQNITQLQRDYLRNAVLHSAEELAHGFVARFNEALTLNESEREALLAAVSAEGLDVSGRFSSRDDGGGDCEDGDDCEVKETIQDTIRRILREGLPSRGIPPLDPLRIDELPEINLDIVDVLELHATLTNLSFAGLSGFKDDVDFEYDFKKLPITRANVSLRFDVLFPRLRLLTQYKASGYAEAGLDIRGEGPINIDIFRLRVKGEILVRVLLLVITVEPCGINLNSRSMNLKIEGLFGGGLLSDLAGEIVTDMINEYWDSVVQKVSNIIDNGVCTKLRSMSVWDWLAILKKIGISPFSATSP